jgi:putative flavoprotein involved in K+ transport
MMKRKGQDLDVVVVGAGPAGVGVGVILKHLGVERFALLERDRVGASFARWPEEMRFITPSFPGNGFGAMDLNAVALATSPAFTLGKEHPSGSEYAAFLEAVADHFELPVRTGVDVEAMEPHRRGFRLRTSQGEIRSRFVVWAAGEFQYPRINGFAGAEECVHSSSVPAWGASEGEERVVIGGYESGIDAAIHLARAGRKVTVLDAKRRWKDRSTSDPSHTLSPFTQERLTAALETGRITLVPDGPVTSVVRTGDGWEVRTSDGETFATGQPPIMATGFRGSLETIADLFERQENGDVLLSEVDESTRTPGLFVAGSEVRHQQAVFCFIYKFRLRFPVVAGAIAQRLGRDTSEIEVYRQAGMYLDDLSCCGEECVC